MRVLVTGAGGFIGQALVRRLLADGLGGRPVQQLVACDLSLQGLPQHACIQCVPGSIAEPGVLQQAVAEPLDALFHLASVPGGAAEKAPDAARRVNLDATAELLAQLSAQGRPGPAPRFVFASTVAVYGHPLPAQVNEDTPARPVMSYGAHKLAAELLVADAARRGGVDACTLRLPGVVARPGDGAGLVSAFMSRLFWQLAAGQPLSLPVSPQGTAWWISVGACVDNLLHAAQLDTATLDAVRPGRVVQMPALWLAVGDVVDAVLRAHPHAGAGLVQYQPQPEVQRLFASQPPLHTPHAQALGFAHDGTVERLVQRALGRTPGDEGGGQVLPHRVGDEASVSAVQAQAKIAWHPGM